MRNFLKNLCFIVISCFSIRITLVISSILPRVTVDQGEIIGTDYVTSSNRIINAFYSVPYAAPPVSKNRFKPPQPVKPWSGFWNASKLSSLCIQYDHGAYTVTGEEDCLYLNIFTPELSINGVSKLMDVLVYIHGGAFMYGSGFGRGVDYLLKQKNVVIIIVNYRLGPLGFFSTGDELVPGNNGLKDQVAALKWIHRNIVKFGGNPSSVTIGGASAGGASVHYHYISSMSRGLFQRGISFSGSVFPTLTLPKNVVENSMKLASYLGCEKNVTGGRIKCLQNRPAKQIVGAVPSFMRWRYCPFTIFGPVIEPPNDNSFLTEDPVDLIKSGGIANVPWLVSMCKHEGLYPVAEFAHSDEYLKQLNDNWYDISPFLFHYNHLPIEAASDISSRIKNFYFGEKVIDKNVINAITQAVGDWLYYVPMKKAIKLHASVSTVPVYCYTFSYRGKYSFSNKYANNLVNYGVSHGDDLLYIFKIKFSNLEEDTKSDDDMTNFMTNLILSFIRFGKVDTNSSIWKSVSADYTLNLDCLEINSAINNRLVDVSDPVTDNFWTSILSERFLTEKVHPEPRVEL